MDLATLTAYSVKVFKIIVCLIRTDKGNKILHRSFKQVPDSEGTMLGDPPDVVPEGLTAEEYLELGNWYQASKKSEQARKCWNSVIELKPDSELSTSAKSKLDEHIPIKEIPQEAIDDFQNALLQNFSDPGACKESLLELIEKHPDFEWPYRAMGELYIRNFGDLKEARAMLEKSLKLNPNYSSAYLTMAELCMVEMNYPEAESYLNKLAEAQPEHDDLDRLRRSLETLIAYE